MWKKADEGSVDAQLQLGAKLEDDDPCEAVAWYKKAADQESPEAQLALSKMYLDGRGIPKNDTESFNWALKAAMHGNVEAYYEVGRKYVEGAGVESSQAEAVRWLSHIANPAKTPDKWLMSRAQLWLGCALLLPEKRNPCEAYKWLNLAATYLPDGEFYGFCSRSSAIEIRDIAANEMTSDQIREAQKACSRMFVAPD